MCPGKKKGGMGIRSLTKLNKSLLGKWNWRLAVKDNPPWKDLIKLKYCLKKGAGSRRNQRGVLGWACGKILEERLSS